MTTCLSCTHWLTKKTDPKMVRMGFAQCGKKMTGHMTSARAASCEKFAPLDAEASKKREEWESKN